MSKPTASQTLVLGYAQSDSDPSKQYPIYWSVREQHAYCTCRSWTCGQYTDPVTGKTYFNRHLSPKDRCCKRRRLRMTALSVS